MADKEETETVAEGTAQEVKGPENTVPDEALQNIETASPENNTTENDDKSQQNPAKDKTKIDILLKATGNAPIMKKKKWAVGQDYAIWRISDFIRKYLKLELNEKLFLYINQTFSPPPDQTVKNLYDCYGTDGKLVIHYCKTQAWG